MAANRTVRDDSLRTIDCFAEYLARHEYLRLLLVGQVDATDERVSLLEDTEYETFAVDTAALRNDIFVSLKNFPSDLDDDSAFGAGSVDCVAQNEHKCLLDATLVCFDIEVALWRAVQVDFDLLVFRLQLHHVGYVSKDF